MRHADTPDETFQLYLARKRLDPRFRGILHTPANVFAYNPGDTKPLYFISTSDEAIEQLADRHAIAAQFYETPWRTECTDGLLRIIHPAADVLVIPFSDYVRFLDHYEYVIGDSAIIQIGRALLAGDQRTLRQAGTRIDVQRVA